MHCNAHIISKIYLMEIQAVKTHHIEIWDSLVELVDRYLTELSEGTVLPVQKYPRREEGFLTEIRARIVNRPLLDSLA